MKLKEPANQDLVESEEEDEPRLKSTDIFRGGLVIVAALLIGGLIMTRGLVNEPSPNTTQTNTSTDQQDDTTTSSSQNTTESSTEAATPSTTVAANAATTEDDGDVMVDNQDGNSALPTPSLRSPAEVKVLVLNGSGQVGVAAKGTEALKAQSYTTAAPKNTDAGAQASAIYYEPGFVGEAGALANVLGAGLEDLVAPLDATSPPIEDMQEANVIVVIGDDGRIATP